MLRLNEYAIKLDREMERNKVLNLFPVINQELRRQSYKINFCLKKTKSALNSFTEHLHK